MASPVPIVEDITAQVVLSSNPDEAQLTISEYPDSVRSEIAAEAAARLPAWELLSAFEFHSLFSSLESAEAHEINFRYFLDPLSELTSNLQKRLEIGE